jgi:hypothetical protein
MQFWHLEHHPTKVKQLPLGPARRCIGAVPSTSSVRRPVQFLAKDAFRPMLSALPSAKVNDDHDERPDEQTRTSPYTRQKHWSSFSGCVSPMTAGLRALRRTPDG